MHRTTNSKTNTAKTCVSSNQNTTQQITKKHQERIAYQLHDQRPKTTTQQNCVVIKPSDLDRILVFYAGAMGRRNRVATSSTDISWVSGVDRSLIGDGTIIAKRLLRMRAEQRERQGLGKIRK
jgi:hypothetical protein